MRSLTLTSYGRSAVWGNPWSGDEIEAGARRMAELDRLIEAGCGWSVPEQDGRRHPRTGADRAPYGSLKAARLERHAAIMRASARVSGRWYWKGGVQVPRRGRKDGAGTSEA